MLTGTILLEHTRIIFTNTENLEICYSVTDIPTNKIAIMTVPQDKFFKALAIAVHNDGMPDYEKDYPDAESIQPSDPVLRWIP